MKHKGTCHCKSVEFEIHSDLSVIKQCNCSICIRKNAKMIILSKDDFKLLKGEESLSLYQFNSEVAKHYFCNKCGIYTHHNRKTDPNGMGVNLGCLNDIDAMTYKADIADGRKL